MSTSSPVDDVNVAFTGLGDRARVTRMRADLAASALDRDLKLAASDGGERGALLPVRRQRNRPAYAACPWPDSVPTPAAAEGIHCSVSRASDRGLWGSVLAAGVALATLASRRRRR